ncbi:MAG: hypothetical protein CVT62_11195 [Actinobacteria bacterium HGW-Actinobacteria-2]|nr:MAG: hypothetical protein CVT62_11195 [Actinobacteria bacterium HGW-Actinobacteria-2]
MWKSVLVGFVGVGMLVVGFLAATWIGSDDWVDSPAQVLNGDGEVAVVTNYGLLSQSFPMRVSAANEGGEVFVGIAHAIDADDYLANTTTSQLGWFSPTELRATPREAAQVALPAAPTALDCWRSSASGPGVQSVEGSFRGQPVVAVVTTPSGVSAPLRIWVGSRWVGAFAAALGMAGLGVALLLLGGWWQWRRRREPVAELPSQSTVGFVGTTALLLSVALCASGCTAPAAPPATDLPPRNQLTRDALDGIDVTALAADYNRRNDAANAASSAPNYSTKEWDNVDTELILHSDYFNTAWKRATKDKTKPEPCPIRLGTPYPGPSSAGYPRTVVIPYGWTCGKGADKPIANYGVFVRDHAYSPWLHAAIVGAPDSAPHNPGTQAPDPSVAALFEAATTTIATQLTTGGPGLALPADLVKWRKEDLKPTYWCTDAWAVQPLRGATRTFSTDKGNVAIASLTIVDTSTARPGQTVQWGKPWSIIYGQPGGYDTITSTDGLMVVLELVDGEVRLTNWYAPNYL